jgi:L-ascorbate metabolism protein UlaG (beta-lactamase superfamily)
VHLWWLGQSGFLVRHRGRSLLLDPYLSDSLTRKYAGTERPHVRLTARVVAPDRLGAVDLVTATHGHTDHLDPDTLRPVLTAGPEAVLVCPESIRPLAVERAGVGGVRVRGLDVGESVEVGGVRVTAVPAAHERRRRDEAGRERDLGYVIEVGPITLYQAGDTVRYPGMAEIVGRHAVDVALLPINGRDPSRGVPGNLDGPEAARLARDLGARLAVPCHFGMFAFNTASPEAFVAEAERLSQAYRVLRAGERFTLTASR